MASFESIQRKIDYRLEHAQNNMANVIQNSTGSLEDAKSFYFASQQLAFATHAVTEQTRFKHNLTKAIIDGVQ